jgi:hypothetical protein
MARHTLTDIVEKESHKAPNFHSLRQAVGTGILLTAILATSPLVSSCGPGPKPTTSSPTTMTTTPISSNPQFNSYIKQMRSDGKTEIADKLVTLYGSEPDVAYCVSFMQRRHPDIAELLIEQPWFKDGMTESERKFVKYGLGNGEQGIAFLQGRDELIKDIILKEHYSLGKIELNAGIKDLVLLHDDSSSALSKENMDLILNIIKASASEIEKVSGAIYPLDAITVVTSNNGDSDTYAYNGIIMFGLQAGVSPTALLEELAHLILISRKGQEVQYKKWITEGFANFSKAYAREKLSQGDYSWWNKEWNSTVQKSYDTYLYSMQKNGVWGMPLSTFEGTPGQKGQMGFLFVKDLYDIMSFDNYTKMMKDIFNYQSGQVSSQAVFNEKTFEEYALKCSPNDAIKAAVQNHFNKQVWGK